VVARLSDAAAQFAGGERCDAVERRRGRRRRRGVAEPERHAVGHAHGGGGGGGIGGGAATDSVTTDTTTGAPAATDASSSVETATRSDEARFAVLKLRLNDIRMYTMLIIQLFNFINFLMKRRCII